MFLQCMHFSGSMTPSNTNPCIFSMIFEWTVWAIATSLPVGWHWWCASAVGRLTKKFFVTATFYFQEHSCSSLPCWTLSPQYWPCIHDKRHIPLFQCVVCIWFFVYPAGKLGCYCAPCSCNTLYRTGSQQFAFHRQWKAWHQNEQLVLLPCTSRAA